MTKNRLKGSSRTGYIPFIIPGVILFLVFIIAPFIANFVFSFTKWTGVGKMKFVGFANYAKAVHDAVFWASFRNNAVLIISMTILPTIIGLILSVVLFEYVAKEVGKKTANLFRAGFYLPQILPAVVAGIAWKWIYQPDWGAVNIFLKSVGLGSWSRDWLGNASTAMAAVMVALVWVQVGYSLIIFMSALQRVDPALYESATIDGATWPRLFANIIIPQIRPEIFVVVLTTVIATLKIFGPIYAMTKGGPGSATIVASYFSYKNFFEYNNVGYGATMANVLSIIVILLTVAYITLQNKQDLKEA